MSIIAIEELPAVAVTAQVVQVQYEQVRGVFTQAWDCSSCGQRHLEANEFVDVVSKYTWNWFIIEDFT